MNLIYLTLNFTIYFFPSNFASYEVFFNRGRFFMITESSNSRGVFGLVKLAVGPEHSPFRGTRPPSLKMFFFRHFDSLNGVVDYVCLLQL
jgi:hypothetical protein